MKTKSAKYLDSPSPSNCSYMYDLLKCLNYGSINKLLHSFTPASRTSYHGSLNFNWDMPAVLTFYSFPLLPGSDDSSTLLEVKGVGW